nr:hypothetical protein [Clostridia bacterium]
MKYCDVVKKAKDEISSRSEYGYGKVQYTSCPTWEKGNQINLWTYWQGFQLDDIDGKGVDILLVGQDWGNPERNKNVCKTIEEIQQGNLTVNYISTASPTDITMKELFTVFGDVDITKRNPGMRLFFTNYSLGYRSGSETGGMTKRLMRQDEELFNDLVSAVKPKIIICLGKITYEMVSGTVTKGFIKQLKAGKPFKASFPMIDTIPVYGVAHPGSRGLSNVGGIDNMLKAWKRIAAEFREL